MAKVSKKYRWDDDDVEQLIDLYEERVCLWDVSDKSYQKRDVKEKALAKISEIMGIDAAVIKAKWGSLRAQHGRELAKENRTKSGQSADDLYQSKWIFMEKMRFVEQIKKTMTSRSTIQLTSDENENAEGLFDDDEEDNFLSPQTPQRPLAKRRKKNSEEIKQTLISKCIDVLDKPN